MKDTALRLADDLINAFSGQGLCACAAAELRRLYAENEALREANDQAVLAAAAILPDDKMIVSRDDYAELVEALRHIEPILARMYGAQAADLPPMQIVRAALAKVEASK